MLLTFLNTVG